MCAKRTYFRGRIEAVLIHILQVPGIETAARQCFAVEIDLKPAPGDDEQLVIVVYLRAYIGFLGQREVADVALAVGYLARDRAARNGRVLLRDGIYAACLFLHSHPP